MMEDLIKSNISLHPSTQSALPSFITWNRAWRCRVEVYFLQNSGEVNNNSNSAGIELKWTFGWSSREEEERENFLPLLVEN